MDITEIRAKYLDILAEKCLHCFNNIDSILVNSYNKIMKHEQIEIHQNSISYDNLKGVYREDVILRMQQYYAKNWDVTYENRKKEEYFIFSYKGDLKIDVQETEVKEVTDKEFKTKEFKTDRCSILDLK